MTTDKTLTKRIRRAACLVGSLLTLALTACVQDEALVLPDRPEPQAPGLHIALAPEGTEPEASTPHGRRGCPEREPHQHRRRVHLQARRHAEPPTATPTAKAATP